MSDNRHYRALFQPKMDTDKLIENWLNDSPVKTQEAYSRDMNRVIGLLGSDKTLLSANIDDLKLIVKKLRTEPLNEHKPGQVLEISTQRRIISAMKSFYKYLYLARHISDNPAIGIKLPKGKDELTQRIISEADYHKIVALEESPRNALIIELLYATGGRISEALSSKWKDTSDLEPIGGQILFFGKGGKTRPVLIPGNLWARLLATKTDITTEEDHIFPSPRDFAKHISESQVRRIVDKASMRAIGRHISPHWFRHAHASHSLQRGAPVPVVMKTLGHSDLRTTTRYVHPVETDSSSMYLPVK